MSQGIPGDRQELYQSAISFLKDTTVADAPLSKKVEFLQSKGLTKEEIDLAIRESQASTTVSNQALSTARDLPASSESVRQEYNYEAVPPPLPRRDWKDYFIMATASAGLCYGVYQLAKRYVLPNLLPEPQAKLEQDKQEIFQQFDKMEKLLTTIEQEQEEFKKKEEEKLVQVDATVIDLQTALDATTRTRERIENEFRMLKLEMTNLQNSIDSFMSDNNNLKEFEKLKEEINSLKNLIKTSSLVRSESPSEGDKSPQSNGIPGVEAIPSASEILAKMNLSKKTDENVPAWKKGKEAALNSSDGSIPEWQKTAMKKAHTPIPDWQKAMLNAESSSGSEDPIS
ncbi:LAFE_0E10286g1_1 [Lachancea fermentati]|uniref:Peroxisomal membrane protein PEX14 n=1 Tax=Lachancea fermentati TaxID=4955 RepID=A0A1G4MDV3_LACFM|nr:LAFE_0E10286g1_1 [Lachancea fermentati]